MSSQGYRNVTPASDPARPDSLDDDPLRWSQLRHFLHAPLRRPLLVLVPWAVVLGLSAVALFVLPKKFMSSTLILVESEKVPESFIPKVATGDRSQRLEAVKPEILSRTRLERVLEETRPYPDLDSRTQAVEKMRKAIFINVTGNDGFTIEFYHRDPRKAQQVTDRLASLFIDETIKSREQQVEGAVDFLVTQVKDARAELESKDAALRRYKEEHMGRLPEQLQTNLATMQMFQRELQTVEESLFFAREKQEMLAREAGRSASAAGAASGSPAPGGTTDLAELRRQLASLRNRYTDEHPDVQSLRARVTRLETRLAEAAPADTQAEGPVARAQLERADLEVRKLEDRQRDLQRRVASITRNVEETPRTEQELATLTRDYQKLNENYVALLSKQLEAQMSGRLEQRWKGERFRMLDPASLPDKPVFPKPSIFLGLGALLGLIVGLGACLVIEYVDPTIKDTEDLQAVQGYPVLACIPHIPDPDDASVAGPPRHGVGPRGPEAHRREAGEKPWGVGLPGEVGFRDDGAVAPRKLVPVLECLADHNSPVGEELRLLVANLMDLCRRRKGSCLAVTSALPAEGKSTVSLGLASALARDTGRRVLLVEADLRHPSFGDALGLPPAPGLSELLNGAIQEAPVRLVEPGGFYLLSAGQMGHRRPEVLRAPEMETLLRAARRLFDFVVLDAVPVLPVADTVLIQDLVDSFLLVARSRQTPRDALRDALARLRADGVVGVVLNDHHEYRGSYKEYGYRRHAPGAADRTDRASAEDPAVVSPAVSAAAMTLVSAARPEPVPVGVVAREPSADPALASEGSRPARGRKRLAAAALAVTVLLGVAGGYLAGRGRSIPPPAVAVSQPANTLSPATPAAEARLKFLEERLQALEAEKAAVAAQAAENARRKVELQAAARGRPADPVALARAQEDARRLAQADEDRRRQAEQERLQAEQRAVTARLAEERRLEEEAKRAADAVAVAAAVAAPTPTGPPAAVATPVPAVTPGALVDLSDPGVIPPVLERATPLTYPPIALRQRIEAIVQLKVLVDETGTVVDVQITSGARNKSGFDEAAVSSVTGRKYRPATRNGVAVKVWVPVRVQFKLP